MDPIFILAPVLKQKYKVSGHFYDLLINEESHPCRSFLEITSIIRLKKHYPCLNVVMMNPGRSRPLDKGYVPEKITPDQIKKGTWKKEVIPTLPDPTQYQLMRLMEELKLSLVRVVNLCDLRNGNATRLQNDLRNIAEIESTGLFSITHKNRERELEVTLSGSTFESPLFAWGENKALKVHAQKMLEKFPEHIGIPTTKPWFSHPSPYLKTQKMDWLQRVIRIIKTQQSSGYSSD